MRRLRCVRVCVVFGRVGGWIKLGETGAAVHSGKGNGPLDGGMRSCMKASLTVLRWR
jgi:hypothetical protein